MASTYSSTSTTAGRDSCAEERDLRVQVSAEAKEWLLAEAGIDPSTGARPLRRTIQRHIQDAVSEILINQHGEAIDFIEVTCPDGALEFAIRSPEMIGDPS